MPAVWKDLKGVKHKRRYFFFRRTHTKRLRNGLKFKKNIRENSANKHHAEPPSLLGSLPGLS